MWRQRTVLFSLPRPGVRPAAWGERNPVPQHSWLAAAGAVSRSFLLSARQGQPLRFILNADCVAMHQEMQIQSSLRGSRRPSSHAEVSEEGLCRDVKAMTVKHGCCYNAGVSHI